jgi:hypothetical protein
MAIQVNKPVSEMPQRDFVAVMLLQGLLANSDYVTGADLRRDKIVAPKKAYELADVLIAESQMGGSTK